MPRTELTPQETLGRWPELPLTADSADLAFEAGDAVNGNEYPSTGRELILARNDGVGAETITVDSVPDRFGRTGDITTYSIGAGEYAILGPIPKEGFAQSDGMVHVDVSAADVNLAIVRIPAGAIV